MLTFFIMTIYSIVALAFKIPFGFIVNSAVAPIGATFTFICLLTGSLWGKPMWGTWWVWDANGTLTFVLWIIFIGYLMVRAYAPDSDRGRRWAAVVGIIGAAAVPFVYMAADWWGGLHPQRVTGPGAEGSLEREMVLSLIHI